MNKSYRLIPAPDQSLPRARSGIQCCTTTGLRVVARNDKGTLNGKGTRNGKGSRNDNGVLRSCWALS
jgi:hypothetical protein